MVMVMVMVLVMVMHQSQTEVHRLLLNKDITTAEAPLSLSSNQSSGTGNGDSDFDSNMVIILAALLCALICALGLNSIVRCALRCSRRLIDLESADDLAATTGLKKDALKRIPVVVYKSGVNIPATECPICLTEFSQGEKVRILPGCNHGFHLKCIDTWLLSHSSCPTCRQLLFQQSASNTISDAEA